jgi:tetratricopeptide (TPR) repeat protein
MPDAWFRRKTWTPKDREEFFARLRRSRGAYNKSQYARIQAYELLTTRTTEAYSAALELLDMILVELREDAQLASVYHHRAECYVGLGDLPRAIDAYHQVFETQRVRKGELTMAHLDFGWLVATTPLPDLYDEALALLGEFTHGMFPVDQYRASAIHALILDALGQRELARGHAVIAIQAAAARHSGFRYHAKLGLVKSPDKQVYEKLQTLLASNEGHQSSFTTSAPN